MWSQIRITSSMSCSTSSTAMPPAASLVRRSPERLRLGLVQSRARLVEQQELGPDGQGPGQLHHAGQAGRTWRSPARRASPSSPTPSSSRSHGGRGRRCRAGRLVGAGRRSGAPVLLAPGTPSALAARSPLPPLDRRLQAHLHVLAGGQRAEQLEPLERAGQPEPGPAVGLHGGDVGVEEVDRAAVGGLQAADHVEQGGLAGAVGPDQPGDRARLHGQADVVESDDPAEPDGHLRTRVRAAVPGRGDSTGGTWSPLPSAAAGRTGVPAPPASRRHRAP